MSAATDKLVSVETSHSKCHLSFGSITIGQEIPWGFGRGECFGFLGLFWGLFLLGLGFF